MPLYEQPNTVFIVLLLGILGMAAGLAATVRVSDTAIGSGLALAAYLLWPTWHSRTARDKFAHLIEAHSRYTAPLLRALAHPGRSTAAELDSLQAAARLAASTPRYRRYGWPVSPNNPRCPPPSRRTWPPPCGGWHTPSWHCTRA